MGNLGIIILIIVILLAMTAFRDGVDEIKEHPIQSTWESTKIIYDNGKKIVETLQEDNTNGTKE
tara:strand:+ start:596 stop:787 length:192 start_codon:yes stop_codon:yes gene_type:complete